ncbi:MAG: aminoacetone oxidase family FAD-binding enzyme [Firmicutes bacterium]|nr:aminoacetone oxidase family FAD-binding enzyme [Bacillota bacterium]
MQNGSKNKTVDLIIIGGGAAGLYLAGRAGRALTAPRPDALAQAPPSILLLEKTEKLGTKLLMSGSGQCNLTHTGDIKEFLLRYGKNGKRIRTCLYHHNNKAVCEFFESLGVKLWEREDGKIFPASMDAKEVRAALLRAAQAGGVAIRTDSHVTSIRPLQSSNEATTETAGPRFALETADGARFYSRYLVAATGGCSYPATGSDGNMFAVLKKDLGISIIDPAPALTPVYIQNYPFGQLSGVSLKNVEIKIFPGNTKSGKKMDNHESYEKPVHTAVGDLLLTHHNLSGPVILNHSRYMKIGTRVEINFLFPYTISSYIGQMKKGFHGNTKTIENWMADQFDLPKRFCQVLCKTTAYDGRKVSTLSGEDMKNLGHIFCAYPCDIEKLGSFRQAMVTAGGVSLEEINLSTMECKTHPGLYVIGEALDIDGDTGGYNLQFAFSSATAALTHIMSPFI